MISEGAVEAVLFAMQIKENAAIQVCSLVSPFPETSAHSQCNLLQEHSCAMLANMALNGTAGPRRLTLCAP
jgi:hypothetical protein